MLIAMMTLVILAEILLFAVTYVNFDPGHGSDTGRWLYVSFFGGAKLMPWWVALNRGPGDATGPGEYHSKPCGHKFPDCRAKYAQPAITSGQPRTGIETTSAGDDCCRAKD